MAWMVTAGEYMDYRVLHVFEDLTGETGAQAWADRYNDAVPPAIWSDRAVVEEVGLTAAGGVPPPVTPVVVEGHLLDHRQE